MLLLRQTIGHAAVVAVQETFRPEKKLNGLADARVVDETAEFPTQKTWLG
jgi:hypothetical protein